MGRFRLSAASTAALSSHDVGGLRSIGLLNPLNPLAGVLSFQNDTGMGYETPAEHAANADKVVSTMKSSDGMRVSGVEWNHSGDFDAFVSGLLVNVAFMLLCFGAFLALRRAYPAIYGHNASNGNVKAKLPDTTLGWIVAALSLTCEQRAEWMGLDIAMAIEFHILCARLMFQIAVPSMLVLAPLNLYFGDNKGIDKLSRIGMANLTYNHPWIYYIIAAVVWAVVVVTEATLRSAQARFLVLRADWLHRQPLPRASTILVEGIPREHRSDQKLRSFFESIFGAESVKGAHVMKRTGDLPDLVAKRAAAKHRKHKAELQWEKAGGHEGDKPLARSSCCSARVDAIKFYSQRAEELGSHIAVRRKQILFQAESVGGVNMDWGFVTFHERQAAEVAMVLRYTYSGEDWRTSLPPEASSVDWRSLTEARPFRVGASVAGYLITLGLFLGFIPICLHITNSAITIDMGPLQPVWAAFAPTLGLFVFVSLLPTVFLWIFQNFFTLYSDTWAQAHLQDWYFLFMIFFVVLVTAIGNDLSEFLRRVAAHPFSIFHLLADKLPYATHFYIHYLVLQWPSHLVHCIRPSNLLRFVGARQLFEEEEARQLSEPEDQGYHGLGSRSARWTINAVIGIVFSTLSPLVALLAGIDFIICRVMFGYVLVFAETKKNDLGGAFWVKQMQHMRVGLLIYCILMIGVLAARSGDTYPALLVFPTLLFVYWSYWRFDSKICMVGLPFAELAARDAASLAEACSGSKAACREPRRDTGEVYVQPELLEENS